VAPRRCGVFCLSCHKAHGSRHDFGLLWANRGPAAASGCEQCHNISRDAPDLPPVAPAEAATGPAPWNARTQASTHSSGSVTEPQPAFFAPAFFTSSR
jgi:hypothetical protein